MGTGSGRCWEGESWEKPLRLRKEQVGKRQKEYREREYKLTTYDRLVILLIFISVYLGRFRALNF